MRPLSWLGFGLIIAGIALLLMRGVSYTKERQDVRVGPIEVAAERKGFVPPAAGIAAMVLGAVLVVAGRRRSA